MCGISALIGPPEKLSAQYIVAMTNLVAHRGPDGEGYLALCGNELQPLMFDPNDPSMVKEMRVLFGHRRLAIVDLSERGRQPMASADGMVWITYNGEVYNHLELRVELERLGHHFVSTSDTEVMLAAYLQWGEGCLARFNGMFAFVLVDRRRRVLWAARDRFGVKPLYWWRAPNGMLALASEIKQFTVLPGWRPRLNGPRARDFLVAGAYEHTDETLFDSVRQLRGGETMHVALDDYYKVRVDRWYELRAKRFSGSYDDAKTGFRELLTDAVRLRLRADVPVGSCLSGGLDSSAIVCLASELRRCDEAPAPQLAFSALSDSPRYDERHYARAVAQHASIELHMVTPSLDRLLDAVDDLVWTQDEPFGSTSIYAQSEVFRLAAAHRVKVMLDGQGADEALGGYPVFRGTVLAEQAIKLQLFCLLRELRVARAGTLRLLMGALVPSAIVDRTRRRAVSQSSLWLDYSRVGVSGAESYFEGESAVRRDFETLSRSQLLVSSLPALLHWEDRSSMAHSVEARVPFLDYRLVEFVLGLPTAAKFYRGISKRVLRESLNEVLPESVASRTDKLGFQLAEDEWMRAHATSMRGALDAAIRASAGILRPGGLKLFDEFCTGARPYSFLFWRMICFSAWMRRFSIAVAG
jgi:asparagine synthase (glutamine-hydrolysing)